VPVIQKPYTRETIEAALARIKQGGGSREE
jgi:hypothetical protein